MAGAAITTPAATLYHGARVIVGDGSDVIADGAILVRNGVIDKVGTSAEVAADDDVTRVDLTGKTVMPTIVNPHGHIGYFKNGSADAASFSRENVLDHLRRLTYYGVSVFQSLGTDRDDIELTVRNEQSAGTLVDPELALLLSASRGLVAPTPGSDNGGAFFAPDSVQEVSTPDEARAKVRELALKKPNVIKLWVDDRNGTKEKFGPEMYGAIIDEARSLGIKTIAHIYELEDAKGVVRAGVSGTAHMVRAPGPDQELLDLLVENDVFVFTSMAIQRGIPQGPGWLDEPYLAESLKPAELAGFKAMFAAMPEGTGAMMAEKYQVLEEGLLTLHNAGVRVLMSADSGVFMQAIGIGEHRELEAMAAAGMPPLAVIRASTQLPAQMLGLEDRGTLEGGKRADLLVLDGDPTLDMTNLHRIHSVIIGGTALDREAMRDSFLS